MIEKGEETEAVMITADNVLLRGCQLRNTDWVLGLVLNTGTQTKVELAPCPLPPLYMPVAMLVAMPVAMPVTTGALALVSHAIRVLPRMVGSIPEGSASRWRRERNSYQWVGQCRCRFSGCRSFLYLHAWRVGPFGLPIGI